MKWEHHVDMSYSSNPGELYTRGEEGWELVAVIHFQANDWRFYWKRAIEETKQQGDGTTN